jgi:hypothetical protein
LSLIPFLAIGLAAFQSAFIDGSMAGLIVFIRLSGGVPFLLILLWLLMQVDRITLHQRSLVRVSGA